MSNLPAPRATTWAAYFPLSGTSPSYSPWILKSGSASAALVVRSGSFGSGFLSCPAPRLASPTSANKIQPSSVRRMRNLRESEEAGSTNTKQAIIPLPLSVPARDSDRKQSVRRKCCRLTTRSAPAAVGPVLYFVYGGGIRNASLLH